MLSRNSSQKRSLLGRAVFLAGGAILVICLLLWISGGARSGLYQTSRAVTKVDPITEIQYQEFEDGFRPGIETLATGFVAFAIFSLASSLIDRRGEPREPQKTVSN